MRLTIEYIYGSIVFVLALMNFDATQTLSCARVGVWYHAQFKSSIATETTWLGKVNLLQWILDKHSVRAKVCTDPSGVFNKFCYKFG